MRKIETIWHHILHMALTQHQYKHTQKELASHYHYSLSTVHHALVVPEQIGAIRKEGKFFILAAFQKLLYYWASVRHLERAIIHRAAMAKPVFEIEGLALPESIFAGYTAARHHLGESPADYAKVYWYLDPKNIQQAEERFSTSLKVKETDNIVFLRMPKAMKNYGDYTTLVQTFVDIWNLSDWYATDFTKALEETINGLLS